MTEPVGNQGVKRSHDDALGTPPPGADQQDAQQEAPQEEDLDAYFARLEEEFRAEAAAKVEQRMTTTTIAEPERRKARVEKEEVAEARPVAPERVVPDKPATASPLAGKVENLRGNFGSGYHEEAHFHPTDKKTHHGVWGKKLGQVKKWVQLALDSIHGDDEYVVTWKRAPGSVNHLVDMKEEIGYLSGSSVERGTRPPTTCMAVYLDDKGTTISAFPCDPDVF